MKRSFQNSVWAIRDARIALVARALSTAGTSVTSIAAILLLHDGGVGALGIAAFLAALVIPAIATIGIAGRVADTMDSRTVLVVASLVQATAVVALGFSHDTAMIFVTGVVISLAQAFEQPTWSALVPRIVGEDRIGQAISWQQGLAAVASPIGAGLGGLLVTLDDVAWGFWVDAATYVLLAAGALIIRTRRHGAVDATPTDGVETPKESWTVGLRVVMRDRILVPLFGAIIVFVVLVEGINPVEVFLARDALEATDWQYGLSEFFAGAGGLIGAAVAGRIHSNVVRARAATIGFGTAALVMIAAGTAPSFWVYAALLTLLVAAFGTGNATFGALLISRTSDLQRGRVSAALNGLARSGSLIALGLGGVGNALLGPRATFIVAGIGGALTMAIASVAVLRAQRAEAAALVAEGD
ncbi:MFS transporter [Microbacterium horticulturae]|uniref:MFS transporter n=1 Tax=Microbacterium horticulturae TaxID=3028316 RepID=A0ABY8BVU6_9MICO|nr:MFS transporter [Microbacterium sp. KACC 23027]WEG08286.1 MFS transporter [Microbacterium sp. KACC 23027]